MKKYCYYFAAVLLAFVVAHHADAQGIDYKHVTAEGIGDSYDGAIREALIQAVGEVNGVAVAQNLKIEKVTGSGSETDVTQSAGVSQSDTQEATTAAAVGETATSSGTDNTQATIVSGASESTSVTATQSISASVTTQDFRTDTKTEDLSVQTSGLVNRYQVVTSDKKPDGWHVLVLAEIAVYKPSEQTFRKKIAVVPFRLGKPSDASQRFEDAFRGQLIEKLTQSGKLAVLDRDYTDEQSNELAMISSGNVRKEDAARLGNELSADFIVVGTIEQAATHTQTAYIASIDRTVVGATTADAEVSYRVIEAATGQIEIADRWDNGSHSFDNLGALAGDASAEISASIVGSLFPMRVERVADGIFYVGEGGKAVAVGQRYRVIKLGEVITDQDTNEVIGREETEIGTVEITEVETRLSLAKLVGPPAIPVPSDNTTMILRAIPEAPSQAAVSPVSSRHKHARHSAVPGPAQPSEQNW